MLKVKVGGVYRQRNGGVATVNSRSSNLLFMYTTSTGGWDYVNEDGHVGEEISKFSFVETIFDPDTLSLKVGEKYVTNSGRAVTVMTELPRRFVVSSELGVTWEVDENGRNELDPIRSLKSKLIPLVVKPGTKYMTRKGNITGVVKIDNSLIASTVIQNVLYAYKVNEQGKSMDGLAVNDLMLELT